MEQLHAADHEFFHDRELVPRDHIPYVLTTDLDEADLFELELEENLCREDLSWMDQAEARAKLHRLRKSQNPEQTVSDTAKEIAKIKGDSTEFERKQVAKALILTEHKDDPRVKKAKSAEEAFKNLLDASEAQFVARLQRSSEAAPSSHQIINADCREAFKSIPKGSVNTIICDPPYGIAAHQAGQESKHYYDDSSPYALEICKFILQAGFELCAPRAILFMFCDVEHFVELREYAKQQAWTPFRTPIIWDKTRGTRAPWGRAGFQRSFELILFAVKGQDELLSPGGKDILSFPQDGKTDRSHAANKPEELLSELIRLTTLPGELVLDPCAGSGSIIPAADKCKVRTICIELDEQYYAQAVARTIRKVGGEEAGGTEEDSEALPEV